MRRRSWVVRRTLVRSRLLLAVAVLAGTVTLLIAGIVGASERGTVDGLRSYLSDIDDSVGSLTFATSVGPDPAVQTAAVGELRAAAFGSLPVDLFRRVKSGPFTVTPGSAAPETVRLGSYDGLTDHARRTAGAWPAATGGAVEVALPQSLAARWGIGVGDALTAAATAASNSETSTSETSTSGAAPVSLRVVGVFAPDDSTFWSADRALVAGAGVSDPSPTLLVAPDATTGLPGVAVSWTVVPRIPAITADQVGPLAAAISSLPNRIRADRVVNVQGTLFAGGLAGSLSVTAAAVDAAVISRPLPVLLVIAFGAVMVLQLGRLLIADRRSETALLLSRGLSARRAARWAAIEALAFALPGAALGLLLAAALTGLPTAGWITAAATVVAAVPALAWPAWRDGATRLTRDRIDDSGRGRSLVVGGVLVLLLGVAAFAVWRFRRAGVQPVTDGRRVIDPAVLLAPPVVLVTLALVAAVLFGVLAGLTERWAARRSAGLTFALPARQVARRSTVFGTAVLLIALAVGGTTVAAGYARTVTDHQQTSAQQTNGADVRVVTGSSAPLTGSPALLDPAAAVRGVAGIEAAGAVMALPATAGDTDITLAGVGAVTLQSVIRPAVAFDRAAAAALPVAGLVSSAPELPAGATHLRLTGTVTVGAVAGGDDATASVTIWLLLPDGAVSPLALGALRASPGRSVTTDLDLVVPVPAGARVLAVDVRTQRWADPVEQQVQLTLRADGHGADAAAVGMTGWAVQPLPGSAESFRATGGELGFRGTGSAAPDGSDPSTTVRLMPPAADASVPALVDADLAAELGLSAGDEISAGLPGFDVHVRVVGILDRVPGFTAVPSMLVDLPALQVALLRSTVVLPATTQVWAASADPAAARTALAAVFGPASRVTAVTDGGAGRLLVPAVTTLWWGAAGALLLALLSTVLVMATLARQRRAELAVLRAVGVHSADQAAMRRRELLGAVLPAWALGVGVGVSAAALLVPGLAAQAVAGGSPGVTPPLVFDAGTAALLLGGHVVAVLVAIAGHGRLVRIRARVADPREVTA